MYESTSMMVLKVKCLNLALTLEELNRHSTVTAAQMWLCVSLCTIVRDGLLCHGH